MQMQPQCFYGHQQADKEYILQEEIFYLYYKHMEIPIAMQSSQLYSIFSAFRNSRTHH